MMDIAFFDSLLMVLAASVAVVVFCLRISIPPIIGYLFVGMLVGPHALKLITDTEIAEKLAEFGVVFLMFTIGLEFSLYKLIRLKHLVFGLGSVQVVLTIFCTTLIGITLGMSFDQAAIIGCIVSMSSTAIVSKQLTEQEELGSISGQNSISILLFQDLAVIPCFIFISTFSTMASNVEFSLMVVLVKTLMAFGIILTVERWILRPLFREIARTESLELFTVSVLLVTLSAAWMTSRLGLTLALGALVSGIMLGETEFRHQIEATIRPFRDIFLGLFFITVGCLFNLSVFFHDWPWILLLFVGLTVAKIFLIGFITYFSNRDIPSSFRTGIILAQGGEFGFALLTFSMKQRLLPADYGQVVLAALLLSMLIAPLLIRYNKTIVNFILPKRFYLSSALLEQESKLTTKHLHNHVILCGFSRLGQHIAKLLDSESVSYVAIETDHQLVLNTKAAGFPVILGDATLYDILSMSKLHKAKAVVITFEHPLVVAKILQQIRAHHKKIPVFVRTHDDSEIDHLMAMGATQVIPTSIETSMTMAKHLLITLKVPKDRVKALLKQVRNTRYRILREIIPGENSDQDES